jgi:rubrerythrin
VSGARLVTPEALRALLPRTSLVMSKQHDIEILLEALELERGAVRRYVEHGAATADPRLVSFWESLRRNEAGHRDALMAHLARLGVTAPPEADAR